MATQTTSFTYTISDQFNTSTATVHVTIDDVASPANAQDDGPVNVTQGNILIYNVLANDSPADVILDILVPPNPTKGTAVIESGQIKYTPNTGQTGNDTIGYQIRSPGSQTIDTGILTVNIQAAPTSGVYTWGYPFPNAAAVDPARVRLISFDQMRNGSAPSPYNTGDILVVTAPNGPINQSENDPNFDIKGPIVLCGFDFRPVPHRIGSPFNASNPYMGTNRTIMIHFAQSAKAHANWEHESGKPIDWPFIFFCNSRINYQTNQCQFGDVMRGGIWGAIAHDPNTFALRGPHCAFFWNKIYLERGPHYADNEVDSNGNTIRTNVFHSDGWQQSNSSKQATGEQAGGTVCWRVANVYMNWIMGQAFFCGNQPEKFGFPRSVRQKYKNVAWEHVAPWDNHPSMPSIGTGNPGNLFNSPRMVMNFEGGFDAPNPVDLSDYGAGKYWAVLFEGQCYIKRSTNNPLTEVDRYLDARGGINGRDANGNWQFSNAVQPNHTYPAWQGNIRLLTSGQTLPQVVDPTHTGPAHRLTSINAFMTAIGR